MKISKKDLMNILHEFDEDNCEATPLNTISFCDYIFYKMKNSKQELMNNPIIRDSTTCFIKETDHGM